ncbi:hypothetical protein SeLEV6574_g00734 [Synchytrium endobioticum]|uniref:Glycosyltransferase 61 catalytic domain-containing protein n=1 Tax=Synchytrium endobioticum TaxID=286115 RepID=A0A507DIM4_9FUNG|nr:hypothetical protein SeLEV6574_g00734 [Synchytrium endobioticum]
MKVKRSIQVPLLLVLTLPVLFWTLHHTLAATEDENAAFSIQNNNRPRGTYHGAASKDSTTTHLSTRVSWAPVVDQSTTTRRRPPKQQQHQHQPQPQATTPIDAAADIQPDKDDVCYGNILNSWRMSDQTICHGVSSSLVCREFVLNTFPQHICEGTNLVLNAGLIHLPKVDTPHFSWPAPIAAHNGSVTADCAMTTTKFDKEWLSPVFAADRSSSKKCDVQLDTLYLLQRWDTTNVFHIHEDLIMSWLAYAVINLHRESTQVIFLDDRRPDGPAIPIWNQVFSQNSNSSLNTSTGAMNLYGLKMAHPNATRLCVKRAIWGPRGGYSPYSHTVGDKSPCRHHLFQAFRNFMLKSLGLPNISRNNNHSTMKDGLPKLRILVVSRRDYNNRTIHRKIENDKDLATNLQTMFAKNATVDLIDFAGMDMIQQIQTWSQYDVTIAAHGSSQVYITYSPLNSAHIEIQHPERIGNFHYRNLATLLGMWYSEIQVHHGKTITQDEIHKITDLVERAMGAIRTRQTLMD